MMEISMSDLNNDVYKFPDVYNGCLEMLSGIPFNEMNDTNKLVSEYF